jgi:hypothetical protein
VLSHGCKMSLEYKQENTREVTASFSVVKSGLEHLLPPGGKITYLCFFGGVG